MTDAHRQGFVSRRHADTPGCYRNSQYICGILNKPAVLQLKVLIRTEKA